MGIKWIQTNATGDMRETLTIIQVDEQIEVRVTGIGTAEYIIEIRPAVVMDEDTLATINQSIANVTGLPGYSSGVAWWGQALVWADELTIAHLVMDVLQNQ